MSDIPVAKTEAAAATATDSSSVLPTNNPPTKALPTGVNPPFEASSKTPPSAANLPNDLPGASKSSEGAPSGSAPSTTSVAPPPASLSSAPTAAPTATAPSASGLQRGNSAPAASGAAAAATKGPDNGSNGQPKFVPTWHKNKEDLPIRRNMITQIVHLLQKRKPNAPPEWLKKIPDMARRLEDSLYRSAPSKDIYRDMDTLKQRLHGVAQSYQRQRSVQGGHSSSSTNNSQQSAQQRMHRSSEQRATSLGGNMVPSGQSRDPRLSGSGGPGGVPGVTAPRHGSQQRPPGEAKKMISKEDQEKVTQQKQQVLRQQQQRLLLLRHASKCKYGTAENSNTCPATKHCKEMKQLWQHITRCKDQRCLRAHCVSGGGFFVLILQCL